MTKYRGFWICLALALITVAVFSRVYTCDFVNYDDHHYVYENPNIQSGITLKAVKWAFSTGYASNWHPLTWLSHMLDWQLFSSRPGGHHLTNLILHIANTLLLFVVLKQMTQRIWPSAFVAALFALHPLHVESVAWVAERKDILSAFFWMLTMWAYLRYVKRPGVGRYLLTLLAFALGLMAKPMLVTVPFVLLLLDYWPLARILSKRHLIYEKIPLFVLSAASSVVTFLVQRSGGAVTGFVHLSLKTRILNALISYIEYIWKMIWPVRLSVYYPHPDQNIPILYGVISAILLLAVTILIIRFSGNHRYLVTGWFWYLGTLVPVIGIIQVGGQALADRYTYIPLTGLFIIIAWGVPDLLAKWRYKKVALTLASLLIISASSICANFQLSYWQNGLTLFQHALDVTVDNYMAHLGISELLRKQGRLDEAINHYLEIVRLKPSLLDAQRDLAYALCDVGRLDEAVKECRKYLQMEPNEPNVLNTLGIALTRQGKYEAIEYFTEALRVKPDFADAHANIGSILVFQGKLDEGIVHLTEAIRLAPNSVEARYYLGQALVQTGKVDEAVIHFEEVLRLKPDWVEPMNNLAWLLSTSKETAIHNPEKAVGIAQRACELTNYKDPRLLDTLSVAYAAAGDFSRAVEIAEKALQLCKSPQQNALKQGIESRLVLYKAGKPYI